MRPTRPAAVTQRSSTGADRPYEDKRDVVPQKTNVPRPGRALAVLAALIVVLLLAIVGKNALTPGKWHNSFAVKLGLDLSSGTTVTLKAVTPKGGTPPAANMQKALEIIRQRVNGTGVTEAQVTQQGPDIIIVAVPGVGQQRVVSLVGKTAQLRFRQVLLAAGNAPAVAPTPTPSSSGSPSSSPSQSATSSPSPSPSSSGHALGTAGGAAGGQALAGATPSPSPSASASAAPSQSPSAPSGQPGEDTSGINPAVLAKFNKLDCTRSDWQRQVGYNPNAEDNPNSQIVACSQDKATKYVLDVAKVEGVDVTSAASGLPNTGNSISTEWQVNLSFNGRATKGFADLTTQMYTRYGNNGNPTSVRDQVAIVLDGVVISAPQVNQGPITGGNVQITGNVTQKSATTLATDQLTGGLIAAAIGMLLVVLYSLLYYRGLGLVAIFSLVVSAILTYLSVLTLGKYLGFALSLAGIAGLIVAIGITADSFVVFFERLRDEVRDGNTLRTAVERGWRRARRTILVSDTVSFLAAVFLYYFAIGDVRGFAFTLGLTTIIDVVVVFLFTKPMITLAANTRFYGGGHPLSVLDPARLGARGSWRASPRPAASGSARATAAPRGAARPGAATQPGGTGRPRTSPNEA